MDEKMNEVNFEMEMGGVEGDALEKVKHNG